jgi:hypothetical protein
VPEDGQIDDLPVISRPVASTGAGPSPYVFLNQACTLARAISCSDDPDCWYAFDAITRRVVLAPRLDGASKRRTLVAARTAFARIAVLLAAEGVRIRKLLDTIDPVSLRPVRSERRTVVINRILLPLDVRQPASFAIASHSASIAAIDCIVRF